MESEVAQDRLTLVDSLKMDAHRLGSALDEHILRHYAPDTSKALRSFSSTEVAALLGVTPAHLRNLRSEGRIPNVGREDSRRSVHYSAAEIDTIREVLQRRSRSPRKFLKRRGDNDKLQVISVSSFKGGSGKSTCCAHLAMRSALAGYRVLMVDLDPQASLSHMMGVNADIALQERNTIYDALRFDDPIPMRDVVRETYFHNISLAPSGLILSEFEQYAALHARAPTGGTPWYLRLSDAINDVSDDFDLVFADCPPSLGFLTLSAMVAASALIVPIVPNMLDAKSAEHFLKMSVALMDVLTEFGVRFDYDFYRYVLTRYEPHDAPQAQLAAFLRVQLGQSLMTSEFVKSTVVSDAGMTNQTLYEIVRSDVTRSAYDRARESFDAVWSELNVCIEAAWGR